MFKVIRFLIIILFSLTFFVNNASAQEIYQSNRVTTRIGNPTVPTPLPPGSGIWPTRRGVVIYDSFVRTHTQLVAIDILQVDTTDDVLATHEGVVMYADYEDRGLSGAYGNVVVVKSETEDLISLYAHLSYIYPDITAGRHIPKGATLGKVGGTSSNPSYRNVHLHYEHRGEGGSYGIIGRGLDLAPPILPKRIPSRCDTIPSCDARWRN